MAAKDEKDKDDPALKAMSWRLVGPYRGGRVIAVAGVAGDPLTYYFGGVGGGVYVGTGEACLRGNIIPGDGVYKSTDAGKTWQFLGLKDTRHIGRVLVNPKNPDIVLVAAMGHAHGPNAERGVFRSTDGGKTWSKTLYKDEKTGAIDLAFDPTNANIVFASLYEAIRRPWEYVGGGPGSGLYRSADGGATWTKLEGKGLPAGPWGRVGVTVAANGNRVWAQIEAEKGGLYRSEDGGTTWSLLNDDRNFRQRAWYYSHIFADPKNADVLYSLNVQMWKSIDGGKSFRQIRAPHGDTHGLWIDPTETQRMIEGNDGGATVTLNGGESWSSLDNQPTSQFYRVITDNQAPYRIYGSQQDNTSVSIPSRTDDNGINNTHWYPVGGCESGYIAPDPKDPNIIYAGCYGGHITRFDARTRQEQEVMAWPLDSLGSGVGEQKYRWQWTAPIVFSPHGGNVLYHGAHKLLKTTDGGMSWTEISPDLTRNDAEKQKSSGGPITQDNTSAEYYSTIFTVAESPLEKGTIWTGSDDGLIHVTRNDGKDWTNVTPKDLPEWSRISLIEASAFDAGTVYVAVDRHELDDFSPIILKTEDHGKTWKRVEGDLPADAFVRSVRSDKKRKGLLFAGTERGVFYSQDDGAHWKSLQRNLPMSSMRDLAVTESDLVVATHGRSFWALDDITPLRDPAPADAEAYLHKPAASLRIFGGPGGRGTGANPPNGVSFYYFLKEGMKKDEKKDEKKDGEKKEPPVKLEILDTAGNVLRTYPDKNAPEAGEGAGAGPGGAPATQPPAEAGLNKFTWDLRYDGVVQVPGSVLWGGSVNGPLALPGQYQARLTVNGKSNTQPFELKADPRQAITMDDMRKQFDLVQKIQKKVGQAHETVNQIRSARKQMNDLSKRLSDAKDPREKAVKDAGKKLDEKMTAVEEALLQTKSKSGQDPLNYGLRLNNQLAALAGNVENVGYAPTKQSYEVYEFLAGKVDEQSAKWKGIVEGDLKAFNGMVKENDVPAIVLEAKP
ncbi:MAG: glycosyl hydrolase [Acidobacteriales bacterium]|nr:glycosyl hydrolase [Terriglobales bacterium]